MSKLFRQCVSVDQEREAWFVPAKHKHIPNIKVPDCPLCGYTDDRQQNIKSHYNTEHWEKGIRLDEKTATLPCSNDCLTDIVGYAGIHYHCLCGEIFDFPRLEHFMSHIRKCSSCSVTKLLFSRSMNLFVNEVAWETFSKQYECPICGFHDTDTSGENHFRQKHYKSLEVTEVAREGNGVLYCVLFNYPKFSVTHLWVKKVENRGHRRIRETSWSQCEEHTRQNIPCWHVQVVGHRYFGTQNTREAIYPMDDVLIHKLKETLYQDKKDGVVRLNTLARKVGAYLLIEQDFNVPGQFWYSVFDGRRDTGICRLNDRALVHRRVVMIDVTPKDIFHCSCQGRYRTDDNSCSHIEIVTLYISGVLKQQEYTQNIYPESDNCPRPAAASRLLEPGIPSPNTLSKHSSSPSTKPSLASTGDNAHTGSAEKQNARTPMNSRQPTMTRESVREGYSGVREEKPMPQEISNDIKEEFIASVFTRLKVIAETAQEVTLNNVYALLDDIIYRHNIYVADERNRGFAFTDKVFEFKLRDAIFTLCCKSCLLGPENSKWKIEGNQETEIVLSKLADLCKQYLPESKFALYADKHAEKTSDHGMETSHRRRSDSYTRPIEHDPLGSTGRPIFTEKFPLHQDSTADRSPASKITIDIQLE